MPIWLHAWVLCAHVIAAPLAHAHQVYSWKEVARFHTASATVHLQTRSLTPCRTDFPPLFGLVELLELCSTISHFRLSTGRVREDRVRTRPDSEDVAESGRLRPSGAASKLFWRCGMGQFPRKCRLRGPSRVTSRYPAGTLYISPGPNCENPAKIRQNLGKN